MPKHTEKEMPFLDHLEELRQRLFWVIGALIVGIIVGFVVVFNLPVIEFLQAPITPYLEGERLQFLSPTDPLKVLMLASFILGLILASPVVIYHIWGFLAPGLYSHEKRMMLPVLVAGAILFLLGVLLSFKVVLPISLKFLLMLGEQIGEANITVSGYYGLAFPMCLAFGAMFELPIVVLTLTHLGIVTPQLLHRFRRYAIMILLVICAAITPPDPTSLLLMFVPVYLLYEVSVLISFVVHRKREKRIAANEAEAIG